MGLIPSFLAFKGLFILQGSDLGLPSSRKFVFILSVLSLISFPTSFLCLFRPFLLRYFSV